MDIKNDTIYQITTKVLLSVGVIDVIIIGKRKHIHYYKDMDAQDVLSLGRVLWNNLSDYLL